jgi:hypothetical protein
LPKHQLNHRTEYSCLHQQGVTFCRQLQVFRGLRQISSGHEDHATGERQVGFITGQLGPGSSTNYGGENRIKNGCQRTLDSFGDCPDTSDRIGSWRVGQIERRDQSLSLHIADVDPECQTVAV